jgi:hypothetical protein
LGITPGKQAAVRTDGREILHISPLSEVWRCLPVSENGSGGASGDATLPDWRSPG